jgi:hypothetical protein
MADFFSTGWPWAGLGIAAVLLVLLFCTNLLRGDRHVPRYRDLAWLAWVAVPMYMLHQFEEHGVDLVGQVYAFRGSLCGMLGYPEVLTCPIPVSFITAVNLPLVWIAMPLSAILGRRRPLLALSAFAVPAVNAMAHIGPGIVRGRYNPGLGTAILLFVPVSIWAIRTAMTRYGIARRGVVLVIASGAALHGVLIGSILLFIRGAISEAALDGVQVANAFLPIVLAHKGSLPSNR